MKTEWHPLKGRIIRHCWRIHDNSIFIASSCGLSGKVRYNLNFMSLGVRRCKNCERALAK